MLVFSMDIVLFLFAVWVVFLVFLTAPTFGCQVDDGEFFQIIEVEEELEVGKPIISVVTRSSGFPD